MTLHRKNQLAAILSFVGIVFLCMTPLVHAPLSFAVDTGPGKTDDPSFTPSGARGEIAGILGIKGELNSPGAIVSALLPYLFALSGMILLIMLVWGGFEILMGAAEPKSQEAGKQRITAALKGFLLLFACIWIVQIIQVVLGINILKN